MITPTVNMNGTSGKALFEMNLAVVEHLRDTINALCKACPNGRDYQTMGATAHGHAMREHKQRMERLQYVYCEMQAIVEALADFA